MQRRRFLQFIATGLLAAQMHFPLGGLPKIPEPAPIVGGVLTPEILRRAVELMRKAAMNPPPEAVIWVHPRDEKRYREMFGYESR